MATVGSIIEGAFGLVRRRPGAVAMWGVTYIVGSIAIFGLMALMAGAAVGFSAGTPPSEIGSGAVGGMIGGMLIFYFLYAMLAIVLINAVYRSILRPHDTSYASLRVGGDEFRMLGLAIVFVIGMIVLYLITILGMMAVTAGLGMVAGNSPALVVLFGALLLIGFICFWIWISVRLSLIFPMTFHRRRFAIDEGWALGRGRFWTLFGSYLVVWVILVVVSLIFFWSVFGALISAIGATSGDDPAARGAAIAQMLEMRAGAGIAGMAFTLIGSTILSLLSFVLGYGVVGSAARELLTEQGDITEDEAERIGEVFE